MKSAHTWAPTKFEVSGFGYRASRNPAEVGIGSRLVGDIQAELYSDLIRRFAHGVLLDLGCGSVPLYGMYRDHVEDATCMDWENTLHPCPHVDVTHDLNTPLPFADHSYDTVLLTDVLEHVSDPERLMDETTRVLRPGGHLILAVPFLYWLHEEPHDYHRFTEYKLREFCEKRGLSIEHLAPYGGVPEVLCDMTAKVLRSAPGAQWYIACAGFLCKRPRVQDYSRKSSKRFPLGYGLVARKPG